MLDYKFELNRKDITENILNFEYSENLDDVASSFSFTSNTDFGLTSTDANGNERINAIKIYKKGQTEPFYVGVITDFEHTTDKDVYSYRGFDVGFYLNKNKVIKQFRGVNITNAIIELCKDYKINIKNSAIPKCKNNVRKMYKNWIFADVIKDLIKLEHDKGGLKDLYIDCKNGALNISQYVKEDDLTSLIGNGFLIKSDKTYSNVSVRQSIRDLKNRVFYSDNNEKNIKYIPAEEPDSIKIFGTLTHVETVDTNKNNNLRQLAESKLKELNKIKEERSLGLLGDYRISKGKLIDFTNSDYGLSGTYLVTSASHTIDNQKEVVNVSIEKRES